MYKMPNHLNARAPSSGNPKFKVCHY